MKTAHNILFQKSLLSKDPTRWKSFVTGTFAQIMLAAAVVVLPSLLPKPLRPSLRTYAVVDLTMPEIPWQAAPLRQGKSIQNRTRTNRKSRTSLADSRNALPLPVISGPVLAMEKSVGRVAPPTVMFTAPVPELPLGVPAIPGLQAPRAQIQTGDFADLGHAAPEGGPTGSGPLSAAPGAATLSMASPVVILFKPRPPYTSDALTNKIQGDVRLAVLFSASGSVKVLWVIQGLGYGLDQSAESAARQIRFRPARNGEGIPVDITAIVRATFNLSYCGAGCLTASTNE